MQLHPFNILHTVITREKLTDQERRLVKKALLQYVTEHPVKSGILSPYLMKSFTVAFASLVLVLGTSFGITQASQSALPDQSLYGVKIWIEEFQANRQATPEDKIAFELNRIETRFREATLLAVAGKLDTITASRIQAGLEHSRSDIHAVTETIQETKPTLALQTMNKLVTSFSGNTKMLAVIENNAQQPMSTVVLAGQVATEKLDQEKLKYEKLVSLQPDAVTEALSATKLDQVREKFARLPIAPTPEVPAQDTQENSSSEPVIATLAMMAPLETSASSTGVTASTSVKALDTFSSDELALTMKTSVTPIISPTETAQVLITSAETKMTKNLYSEALIDLGRAEQLIDEVLLTKQLEETYQVTKTRE